MTTTGTNNGVPDLVAYGAQKAKNEAIIAWANMQYSKCKSQRLPVERQWYVNLAMFFGLHNVQMVTTAASTTGFQFITPKAPPWRVRLIINRMSMVVRKQVALLTQQKPKFFALPASTDDEDLMSARVAESLLDAFYREQNLRNKIGTMAWWGSICGTSFVKTYWDDAKKDASGAMGTIVPEVIDPFHIFVPDLLQEDIELQPYVIHAKTVSPDLAKTRYKLDVTPNVSGTSSLFEDQFLNLVGVQQKAKDQVLLLEFWIKPNLFKLFPDGGLLTIVGDQVGQCVYGLPYDHAQSPFAKFTDIESGRFYGVSILQDLIPVQRELNRTRSQVTEAKNLMAKPKLLAPRGSINANQVTTEPGQVIFFNPGMEKPIPLPLTPLPAYVLEELDRFQRDIEDMSGQHDISRLISSRTSATALSYVQNADSMMMSHATAQLEAVVEKVGRQFISLVRQYWNTPRTVKIVGTDEAFETQLWKGSNVHDNTEVYVETGSALPQDMAARQAFLMDLMKMGALQPQQMLEMLDIGGIEKVYQDYLVDKRQAQRENIKMMMLGIQISKMPPPPTQPQLPDLPPELLALLGGNSEPTDNTASPAVPGGPIASPPISPAGPAGP